MADTLTLHRLAGPESPTGPDQIVIETDEATLGRSATCDHTLPDPSVSRLHAKVQRRDAEWRLTDLNSTTGTYIDGLRIEPRLPTTLRTGMDLAIGPWRLRVDLGDQPVGAGIGDHSVQLPTMMSTTSATAMAPSRRLQALSGLIDQLISAESETDLATAALTSALRGGGFARGAVLRVSGEDPSRRATVDAIVSLEQRQERAEPALAATTELRVSTALVDIAASGQTATFSEADRAQPMGLHSIAELQIHSAVCVPVRIDRRIVALLYVDARGRESKVDDAASFCEDVAQLLGLALAYAARTEQSKRQAALQAELERARSLRDLLTPPEVVEANGWRIAHRTLAGLFVSGDLFDVAAGPKDAAPVLLFGDATGHGVGAAMLTSLVHAHLHATVTQGGPLDAAVERTNGFVTSRPTGGSFVSLFAAALGAGGELSCLDAGHGYWRLVRAAGEIEPASRATGPPLGVDAEARYPTTTRTLGTRDRLVLFTDGVVEQRDASGRELGLAAVDAALRGSASAEDDVTRLLSMLEVAAGQRGVDDDATVASIERLD